MSIMKTPFTMLLLSLFLMYCSESEKDDSGLDFHQSIAAAFDQANFEPRHLNEICGDSITVLVGNAEHMGFNVEWAKGISQDQINKQIKEEEKDAEAFYRAIQTTELNLSNTLSQNPCGDRTTRNAFISITDAHGLGPKQEGNSAIKIASWVWQNGTLTQESISPRQYMLSPRSGLQEGNGPFELHMSRDAVGIAKALLDQHFSHWNNPQMTFIFKMHGSTFEDEDKNLFNGVLFDGYTSTAQTGVSSFTPYYDASWMYADIERECKNYLTANISDDLKAFCSFWAEDDEANLLTSNRAHSKQGRTDSGRTDSGRTDSGRTDSGRTDSGRTDSGRTDSGRTDSGLIATMKLSKPPRLQESFDLDTPQGIFQSTHFATYNSEKVDPNKGIFPFQWPVPKYTKAVPVYTVFDSCQQSVEAYQAIGKQVNATTPAAAPYIPVIGRSSFDSVDFEELDYSALNSLQIKALPYVMYWAATPGHPMATPAIKELAKKIDNAFRARAVKDAKENNKISTLNSVFNQFSVCVEQGKCNQFGN